MKRNTFTPNQIAWLEALESGEWKQGRERLRKGDAYCCLGVATKIVAPYSRAIKLSCGLSIGHGCSGNQSAPPITVNRIGFRTPEGGSGLDGANLAFMNDEGRTFSEIAAFVRKKPWLVFTNFDAPEAT